MRQGHVRQLRECLVERALRGLRQLAGNRSQRPDVFQAFTGVLDEADQALGRAARFLRQHIRANS
jgi:hypothetical protein